MYVGIYGVCFSSSLRSYLPSSIMDFPIRAIALWPGTCPITDLLALSNKRSLYLEPEKILSIL